MEEAFLPRRGRGRPTPAAEAKYQVLLAAFCDRILQINSSLDFAIGSRDWCYLLEQHGLRKGDFDGAQKLIGDCRKNGMLPLDICAEDSTRATDGIEKLNNTSIKEEVADWVDHIRKRAHRQYNPISFWDDLDVYVEVAVEKLGLKNLFAPVCEHFHVPVTNFKGWSDLNSRSAMMRRFKRWEEREKLCVLLTCCDHDPGGLHITEMIRKNLEDLRNARSDDSGPIDWSPDNLVIIRFGLNKDFIDRHDLTWIDNLETSSGMQLDDPDHNDNGKAYVQDYIAEFGVRKCEANALVARPEIGRQLCRDAILEHIPADAVERYTRKLARIRATLRWQLRKRIT
jgi:hypothetical protein